MLLVLMDYSLLHADVCGYVKHITNIGVVPHIGYIEKEVVLALESTLKGVAWYGFLSISSDISYCTSY